VVTMTQIATTIALWAPFLLAQTQRKKPLLRALDSGTRISAILTLSVLILLGVLLVVMVRLGAVWTRRYAGLSPSGGKRGKRPTYHPDEWSRKPLVKPLTKEDFPPDEPPEEDIPEPDDDDGVK